ncbi:MAG: hypothetical protein M3N95_15615 [Actinomycetota bacterium]|nr:hypothetical protein [Actinomycetota bacterium]
MSWTWRLEAADGALVTTQSAPAHPNQSDAESWLGENWRKLADEGVARATLLDGTTEIYGPMSLAEE